MKRAKMCAGFPSLGIGSILWFFSHYILQNSIDVADYIHRVVFREIQMAESTDMRGDYITIYLYMGITLAAIAFLCAGVISLNYEKPFHKALGYQVERYLPFFVLLPNILLSIASDLMWYKMPALPYNSFVEFLEFGGLLRVTSALDGVFLSVLCLSVFILSLLYAYDILIKGRKIFNIVCSVLCALYAYNTLYIAILYFKYVVGLLIFVLLCYIGTVVILFLHKRKCREPLKPEYSLFIYSYDDEEESDQETDGKDYDFSIFMPQDDSKKCETTEKALRMQLKCKNCNQTTKHRFISKHKVIRMVSPHRKPKKRHFKNREALLLSKTVYYLHSYSVYECLKCGRRRKVLGTAKKISKTNARASGVKVMSNLAFWSLMRR